MPCSSTVISIGSFNPVKNGPGTTESTFRCCVYNVEKSTAIDGNIENTVTLKLKSEQTYV